MNSHFVVQFDPVIFSLGPLQVRWYGFMYVVGYIIGGQLLRHLAKNGYFQAPVEKADALITYLLIGMFVGARLTYVFVYNWDYYSQHIDELFSVWQGGLSFHGAIVGMALAGWYFSKKHGIHPLQALDSMVVCGTQGLFWGRLGNFINGELYGRTTDAAIGMIFPAGGPMPRHPSQLYEGVFEGLVLGAILWWWARPRLKIHGLCTAVFLMGYAFFRFGIEFFREPDAQLGYYFSGVTMGQILCLLMFLVGAWTWWYAKKKNVPVPVI